MAELVRGRAGERAKANNVFHPRRFVFPCARRWDRDGGKRCSSSQTRSFPHHFFPGARLLLASGVARRLWAAYLAITVESSKTENNQKMYRIYMELRDGDDGEQVANKAEHQTGTVHVVKYATSNYRMEEANGNQRWLSLFPKRPASESNNCA